MSDYSNITPPEQLNVPFDEKYILESFQGKPENFVDFFKNFLRIYNQTYGDMRNALMAAPEYAEGTSQPLPADGRFMVWKDTSVTPAVYRLLYGDGGASKVVEGSDFPIADETQKGIVERATDAEAQAGTDTERYITPKHLKDNMTVGFANLPLVILKHTESSGTAGGGQNAGSWVTRKLNTEAVDTKNICSLSNNEFTIPAGTYDIDANFQFLYVGYGQVRLYNVTDSAVQQDVGGNDIYGTTAGAYNGGTWWTAQYSKIKTRFTLSAQKTLRIESMVYYNNPTNGWGGAASFGVPEVYSVLKLVKVA